MSQDDRWLTIEDPCAKLGVYCTKCRSRMLPSLVPKGSEKFYYCMVCRTAVGQSSGSIQSILSLVKKKAA